MTSCSGMVMLQAWWSSL